jgi:hypothetical protein
MEKDIGKIKKNDTTEIVVRLDDFGGRKGLTIREFVTSERYNGFTKSGVRILGPDFIKFREMINSINLADMKDEEGAASGASGTSAAKPAKFTPKSQKTLSETASKKPVVSEDEDIDEELPDY